MPIRPSVLAAKVDHFDSTMPPASVTRGPTSVLARSHATSACSRNVSLN